MSTRRTHSSLKPQSRMPATKENPESVSKSERRETPEISAIYHKVSTTSTVSYKNFYKNDPSKTPVLIKFFLFPLHSLSLRTLNFGDTGGASNPAGFVSPRAVTSVTANMMVSNGMRLSTSQLTHYSS